MPNTKSAAKRLRQTEKRTQRNQSVKLNIAYLLRQAKKMIEVKDKTKAQEIVLKFQKTMDKAVQKGVLHKNTGARKKSKLMLKFNALK